MSNHYHPRGDFVLVREIRAKVGDLHMPDISIQGKQYFVEAIGPKVKNLSKGDQVLMTGHKGVDWSLLPNSQDLMIIREGNIVCIVDKESQTEDS